MRDFVEVIEHQIGDYPENWVNQNITLKDLKALLKKFVKEEDYESAAKVRDELSSRKKDK